jgi:S-DNA-T family DNA segregation ATPase FtsK/SpoIIIE
LQQGRACGIHFVIATQRPEREVLKGSIKANIEYKVCFKVTNRVNSQIILDGDEAAELPEVKGRAIFQKGKNIEVQTPYLSEKKTVSLIEKEIRPSGNQYEIDFGGVVRD